MPGTAGLARHQSGRPCFGDDAAVSLPALRHPPSSSLGDSPFPCATLPSNPPCGRSPRRPAVLHISAQRARASYVDAGGSCPPPTQGPLHHHRTQRACAPDADPMSHSTAIRRRRRPTFRSRASAPHLEAEAPASRCGARHRTWGRVQVPGTSSDVARRRLTAPAVAWPAAARPRPPSPGHPRRLKGWLREPTAGTLPSSSGAADRHTGSACVQRARGHTRQPDELDRPVVLFPAVEDEELRTTRRGPPNGRHRIAIPGRRGGTTVRKLRPPWLTKSMSSGLVSIASSRTNRRCPAARRRSRPRWRRPTPRSCPGRRREPHRGAEAGQKCRAAERTRWDRWSRGRHIRRRRDRPARLR